jgi:hypothetical protein
MLVVFWECLFCAYRKWGVRKTVYANRFYKVQPRHVAKAQRRMQ